MSYYTGTYNMIHKSNMKNYTYIAKITQFNSKQL